MGVAARYINSNLKVQDAFNDAVAGRTFAVDVSGFFVSEEKASMISMAVTDWVSTSRIWAKNQL
jgi:uncharacterized hydantoinase/oxoprolinase family protein